MTLIALNRTHFRNIVSELKLQEAGVLTTARLLEEDTTVPFIARYRKEKTGGLDEEQLRQIEKLNNYFTLLNERKLTILNSIKEQGKLTSILESKINDAVGHLGSSIMDQCIGSIKHNVDFMITNAFNNYSNNGIY